jgi:hypothetical protein
MDAKRITMQIVKNLGNYETVRLEAEYDILPGDDINTCFSIAKEQLTISFEKMYTKPAPAPAPAPALPTLSIGTDEFFRICRAIYDGKANIELVKKHYHIDSNVENYLKTNKLWK